MIHQYRHIIKKNWNCTSSFICTYSYSYLSFILIVGVTWLSMWRYVIYHPLTLTWVLHTCDFSIQLLKCTFVYIRYENKTPSYVLMILHYVYIDVFLNFVQNCLFCLTSFCTLYQEIVVNQFVTRWRYLFHIGTINSSIFMHLLLLC